MSNFNDGQQGYGGTYFVQDKENKEELARLVIQDQMLTVGMGGVLPEQPDPTCLQRVLDIGCGTGGWLIEVAKTYPHISLLVGVDVSKQMIEFAREQAKAQGVDDRVEFRVMDALLILEFPQNCFDLVNQRLGVSYLRTWDWPKLLREYRRVCKADGVIRITEAEIIAHSNSVAHMRLAQLGLEALYQAGHLFIPQSDGLTSQLVPLLGRHGLKDVQTQEHHLEYRAGTCAGQLFAEDMSRIYRTMLPFLRTRLRVPHDYETLCQQAANEMQQPDFVATWDYLTVWGRN